MNIDDSLKQHYKKFTDNKDVFLGSQPIQIQKSRFCRLLNINICVTPKIDGVRYLMFVDKTKMGFVNRGLQYYNLSDVKIPNKNEFSFLVDVEVVENEGKVYVFMFDLIYDQLGDVRRDIHQMPYKKRHNILFGHYNEFFKKMNNENVTFFYKGYLPFSSIVSYEKIIEEWENLMYIKKGMVQYDGLIFIDQWSKYFFDVSYGQYKWKPPKDLTVDLLYSGGKLLDSSKNEYNGSTKDLEENKVYEFKFDPKGKLSLAKKEPREKKENSALTIDAVKNAILFPVEIEYVTKAFQGDYTVLDKKTLLQLVWLYCFGRVPLSKLKWNIGDWYEKCSEDNVSHVDKVLRMLDMAGELGMDITEQFEKMTIGSPLRAQCKLFIEFNVKYDSGFKKQKGKSNLVSERNRNLSNKMEDTEYLIRKLMYNNKMKPISIENKTEYWKIARNSFECHVYNNDDTISEIITDVDRTEKVLLEPGVYPWDYGVKLCGERTSFKELPVGNPSRKPDKHNLKRTKKTYSFRLERYTLLKLIVMSEEKKIKEQWRTSKKSFIEIHYDWKGYPIEGKELENWISENVTGLFKQII